MLRTGLILLLAVPGIATAQIDSGGGKSQIGSWVNHSSIGGSVATGTYQVGAETARTGLIEVIYAAGTIYDSSGNGIPDWWEQFHFPGQTVDPNADTDGDGTSNVMEYLAGTNPNDPSSKFQPQGEHDGSLFNLPLLTAQGRQYRIWVTRNLNDWYLHETIQGDGTLKVFSFDETSIQSGPLQSDTNPSSYFFRVEIIIP